MRIRLILLFLGILGLSAFAAAEVPHVVNYQGRLIDDNGDPVPDDYYKLSFTVYDHPTDFAGHVLWTSGQQSVAVTNGLFTYLLGSSVPFTFDLTADTLLWLGISVGGEAEMTPRTQMSTVPFAFRALVADEVSDEGDEWLDETGDTLEGTLYFDTDGQAGQLTISGGASNISLANNGYTTAELFGNPSGSLHLKTSDGGNRVITYAGSSNGGHLSLLNTVGFTTVRLDANNTAGGSLRLSTGVDATSAYMYTTDECGALSMYGADGSSIYFNGSLEGDETVILPNDAVNSAEILNEPGIAANENSSLFSLGSTTMEDIATVTITIPEPGYIIVTAKAWGRHNGTTGRAVSRAQIDEYAGGYADYPYYVVWGAYSYPTTESYYATIFTQRVYFKMAGTFTFRLEAAQWLTSSGSVHTIGDPIVVATYYPTSYGSVNTFVKTSEAADFENAEYTNASRTIDNRTETTETNVVVDLRELEIKADKLRKEIEEREIELRETELKMEQEKRDSELDSRENR